MRNIKPILAAVIAVTIAAAVIPFAFPARAAVNGVQKKLDEIRAVYPNGSYFTADGQIMIFSSIDKNRGLGGYDLWYTIFDGKEWGKPKNLGSRINTSADEISPSIYRDGLLFSGEWGGKCVTIWDARDMKSPTRLACCPLASNGDGVWVDGRWLYASTGFNVEDKKPGATAHPGQMGLEIYDVANPDDTAADLTVQIVPEGSSGGALYYRSFTLPPHASITGFIPVTFSATADRHTHSMAQHSSRKTILFFIGSSLSDLIVW